MNIPEVMKKTLDKMDDKTVMSTAKLLMLEVAQDFWAKFDLDFDEANEIDDLEFEVIKGNISKWGWLAPIYWQLAEKAQEEGLYISWQDPSNNTIPSVGVILRVHMAEADDPWKKRELWNESIVPLGYALKLAQMGLLGKQEDFIGTVMYQYYPPINWHDLVREVREN